MDCPRCHLPLRREMYEGVEIDFCDSCWGCWLDNGEFSAIIESRDMEFSEAEKAKVLDVMSASKPGPRGQILCPRCQNFMEQVQYSESVRLLVDRCPDHGVWLDAGEIKKAQAIGEKSREIQGMIVRKLRLEQEQD